MDRLIGHREVESAVILGAGLGGRISCTKRSSTSVGAAPLDYPTSTQHDKVQLRVILLIRESGEVPYLSHRQRIGRRPHQGAQPPQFRRGQKKCP